jgi:hypothetical protein
MYNFSKQIKCVYLDGLLKNTSWQKRPWQKLVLGKTGVAPKTIAKKNR